MVNVTELLMLQLGRKKSVISYQNKANPIEKPFVLMKLSLLIFILCETFLNV